MALSITIPEQQKNVNVKKQQENNNNDNNRGYQQRGQCLRAAVLGANDGLVSTGSLMMGVGAVKTDAKAMLISGFAAMVAGALSMAIGEYVSVSTQRDIELSALNNNVNKNAKENDGEDAVVPNALQAAGVSATAFAVGAVVPLLSAAFIADYVTRVGVMACTSTVALSLFGGIGSYYGGASIVKGTARVVVGGWLAMLLTFGMLKLFSHSVHL